MSTYELLKRTREALGALRASGADKKNAMLHSMAGRLLEEADTILAANARDIEKARGTMSPVMLDRLLLTKERLSAMAHGIDEIAALGDPVGEVLSETVRPNGLVIQKKRVPIGLIAIVYESRPNVTSDAAALALKSGNVCVLRCGSDAYESCRAIVMALKHALSAVGANPDILNLVDDPTRESARVLMTAEGLVDLLIPRGGAGLIRACTEQATVPCIETGTGICHIYVDRAADIDQALAILSNAKTSRPSVCNAAEVCLVHEAIAEVFLPRMKHCLVDERIERGLVPVELRLDARSSAIIDGTAAGPDDFDTEFLDYILAVAVVGSVSEAAAHIHRHSTGHSEAIVTKEAASAEQFISAIDSAAVYVNASTRFTDGGEFGLGCEMGISTQKLHARGPMGLSELTTYQYIIQGNGQIR